MNCASCKSVDCREGKDCTGNADRYLKTYENEPVCRLHRAASAIEARHYLKAPRLQEVIFLAKEINVRKVGLAFCIGLSEEARLVEKILSQDFEVVSVCCKICGVAKERFDLEKIHPENENEVMCNPAGQAEILNEAGTGLNIICGLCVGHDAVFCMASKAPVTTLIAKDRVLAHNPVGAIYSQYIRNRFFPSSDNT